MSNILTPFVIVCALFPATTVRPQSNVPPAAPAMVNGLPKPPPPTGLGKERLERWKSQEFVSLTNHPDLHQLVAGFGIAPREPMTEEQHTALTEAVVRFITYVQSGTLDDYMRFRMPVNDFTFAGGVSNVMREKVSVPEEIIKGSPRVAFTMWWSAFHKQVYSNRWVGLSVKNCQISVARSASPTDDWEETLKRANPTLAYDSIWKLETFIRALKSPSDTDKLSPYLRSQLSPAVWEKLSSFNFDGKTEGWAYYKAAVDDLNRIIQSQALYQPERFAGIALSAESSKLLAENPVGAGRTKLNRLLLHDAYPQAIRNEACVDNVGFDWTDPPTVSLVPSRADIVKSDGFVDVATVVLLPKPRGDYSIVPIYLRFYWSPGDKKWLPEQMITCSSRGDALTLSF